MGLAPIGGAKTIEWEINSKKDRRWNKSGKTRGFVGLRVGSANKWLKKCYRKYGKPPSDLIYISGAIMGNTSRTTWFKPESIRD